MKSADPRGGKCRKTEYLGNDPDIDSEGDEGCNSRDRSHTGQYCRIMEKQFKVRGHAIENSASPFPASITKTNQTEKKRKKKRDGSKERIKPRKKLIAPITE